VEALMPEMIQRTTKQSLIIIPALAATSFFFSDWLFAFNVLLGGGISLLSFRTVAWSVRKFIGMQMVQPVIMGISILKVTLIFLFLVILAYFRLIKPIPLMVGFILVLAIVIKEGFIASRKDSSS
jgi:F0F1-type ATP synthase assembly protein I